MLRAGVSPEEAERLLWLGAIHGDGRRVTELDGVVAYLRVHRAPRRYGLPEASEWRERVVFHGDDFLCLDKPFGVPMHATIDNARENVLVALGEALGQRVYLTHRLDVGTEGLVLLATTPRGQSMVNGWLSRRLVTKRYEALTSAPVPLGPQVHWMLPGDRAPRIVVTEEREDADRCELIVDGCEACGRGLYRLRVSLLTGRTHQIRAQLAAVGAPIVGDALYGHERALGAAAPRHALACVELGLPGPARRVVSIVRAGLDATAWPSESAPHATT